MRLRPYLYWWLRHIDFKSRWCCEISRSCQNFPPIIVCLGYSLSNLQKTDRGLTRSLTLSGPACDVYGRDYTNLTLMVCYDTETCLHVTIEGDEKARYRVPETLVSIPPPAASICNVTYPSITTKRLSDFALFARTGISSSIPESIK